MYNTLQQFILASASPRRSDMLASCGIVFTKAVADVDESVLLGEAPEAMVERLALLKAQAVAERFPNGWILGADTTVVIGGEILGKPSDKKEAHKFLKKIQSATHSVWGAFSLVHIGKNESLVRAFESRVTIAPLNDSEIDSYIESGEPMDKAGAYAIQGIGASLVEKVEGSYTNVVGLNLSSVIAECKRLGIISAV